MDIVDAEVDKFLRKQVIYKSKRERNDYLSNVLSPEIRRMEEMHDFKSKTIQYPLTYQHFKMESINQVIDIVRSYVYVYGINRFKRCLLLHPSQYIHNIKNI